MAKKVMIVDDDSCLCDMMLDAFSLLPAQAVAVGSAEKALELMETESFAVVLTDHSMPGMNGDTFAGIIRERWPETVVFGMTGDPSMKEWLEPFCRRVFIKPFIVSQILAHVYHVLAGCWLGDEGKVSGTRQD